MATPAIENLIQTLNQPEITLLGSPVSTQTMARHPNVVSTIVINKKYKELYKTARSIGEFDIFMSFRFSPRTTFFKRFVKAKKKYQYIEKKYLGRHVVDRYNDFVNDSLGTSLSPGSLVVYGFDPAIKSGKKQLGLNPGAAYGSAKRWYPEEFAQVGIDLAAEYDITIFGGPNEVEMGKDIEQVLIDSGVTNYRNLAGKTTIPQLLEEISSMNLLVTGDSGPMHVAAAYQVPTVAIFGPTRHKESNQWRNAKSVIVRKNLECQPCMKRTCPLGHHNCMKQIKAIDVIQAAKQF